MARYKDRYARYCEACHPSQPRESVRLSHWLTANYRTRNQVNRLLRKRLLLGKKFKGVMYVYVNPLLADLGITIDDFLECL